jgi:hypothetical protein
MELLTSGQAGLAAAMKGLFLLGVMCATAFLAHRNSGPARAHAADMSEARCKMWVDVLAARDTSIFMLATAKSDTVFAGGEERVVSDAWLRIKKGATPQTAFPDSFLFMTRNLRAYGQFMVADSFVGPGSDRVRAEFARSGSRDIVVVPWGYGGMCEVSFWYGTAQFTTPDQEGFYVLQLRPDSLWVQQRPTFDAVYAQLYSYAPGTNLAGPSKMFPGDVSTGPGSGARQLFEIYRRLPASRADTLRVRLLREWLQANPGVRDFYPARRLLSAWDSTAAAASAQTRTALQE